MAEIKRLQRYHQMFRGFSLCVSLFIFVFTFYAKSNSKNRTVCPLCPQPTQPLFPKYQTYSVQNTKFTNPDKQTYS